MGEGRAMTVVLESPAPVELVSGDRCQRRAALLATALGDGLSLREAMEDAARAELWLTGALGSARVLGMETLFGRVIETPAGDPAPAAAPAYPSEEIDTPAPTQSEPSEDAPALDAVLGDLPGPDAPDPEPPAGEAAPLDAGSEPFPREPEAPAGDAADPAELILAAIAARGPDVSNAELADAAGVSRGDIGRRLRKLKEAGRITVRGSTVARCLYVAGDPAIPADEPTPAPEATAAPEPPVLDRRVAPGNDRSSEPAMPPVRRFEPGTMESLVLGSLREHGHEARKAPPPAGLRGWWLLDGKKMQWSRLVEKVDTYRVALGLEPIGRPE